LSFGAVNVFAAFLEIILECCIFVARYFFRYGSGCDDGFTKTKT